MDRNSSNNNSGYAIQTKNLKKLYNDFVALENLNLQIEYGKVLGLVGPNGAGKTTAMRCLAGIIPASEGEIYISGNLLNVDSSSAKNYLSFVPDTPRLFEYLTVEDHLRFAGRIYQVPDIEVQIGQLLSQFELLDKAKSLPRELSRGMKQKVAICMGFLHNPDAIILDEPLSGLDPLAIRKMKETIINRAKTNHAGVIVSSHQLELIEAICDEICILNKGRCLFSGTMDELHETLNDTANSQTLEDLFLSITQNVAIDNT